MNAKSLRRSLCGWLLVCVWVQPLYAASDLERSVFAELNIARTTPAVYVKHLQDFRTRFTDRFYTRPGSNTRIRTVEGTRAVDEAIAALHKQRPVAALQWEEWLAKSGAELTRLQGKNSETGHGQGAFTMEKRISRHGDWLVTIGENVAYGSYVADQGREVIIQLLVDDGVPGRGHRKSIYNADFQQAGVACGPHPAYNTVCVIDFSGGGVAK